jgi:hypothetical protein
MAQTFTDFDKIEELKKTVFNLLAVQDKELQAMLHF